MIRPPSPWATVLTGLAGTAIALVLMFAYVNRVDQASERRNVERQQQLDRDNIARQRQICGIVVIIDDRNQQMPPSTDPATTEFRRELHAYRISLGC